MPARTSPTLHPHPLPLCINCLVLISRIVGFDSLLCKDFNFILILTLKVLVATIDAQWEGMGDVGSARYEPALLPPCPTIRVLSYSN